MSTEKMVKIVGGAKEAGIWDRLILFLREPRGIPPSNDLRLAVHLCSILAGVWTSRRDAECRNSSVLLYSLQCTFKPGRICSF